jgi:hypothetical protein
LTPIPNNPILIDNSKITASAKAYEVNTGGQIAGYSSSAQSSIDKRWFFPGVEALIDEQMESREYRFSSLFHVVE